MTRVHFLFAAWLILGLGVVIEPRAVVAQDSWEYTPYRIRLWVVSDDGSELSEHGRHTIERGLVERAEKIVGAPWDVTGGSPPPALHYDLASRLETLTSDELLASLKTAPVAVPPTKNPAEPSDPSAPQPPSPSPQPAAPNPTVLLLKELLRGDKLVVVGVRSQAVGFQVLVREFDCKSRRWGVCVLQTVPVAEQIVEAAFSAWLAGFTPIARFENAKDKLAVFRLRAAGLALREDSPVLCDKAAIWRPFIRNNDRFGEPRATGIVPVQFTYVVVTERDGSKIKCEIHSGLHTPLSGRNNPRTERFALFVRPTFEFTRLRLRTNDKPPRPMSGYEIYAKDPVTDDVQELGRTDWRGTVDVPKADFPLRIIYLRNGGLLLARLPVVPGVEAEQFVDLASDDRRLQAEGFVAGVQSTIMDLMAQRELLAARFRKRLDDGKFDEAQKLLEEFKGLETRDDISRLLDLQSNRITSPHKSVQAKITKLFDESRKNLQKFIDPDLGNRLANELAAAKEGKPRGPATPKTDTSNANTGPQPENVNPIADDANQSLLDRMRFNSSGLILVGLAIAVMVCGAMNFETLLKKSHAPDYVFFITRTWMRILLVLIGVGLLIFGTLVTAGLV